MRFFVTVLTFLSFTFPALGDYGQVSRCYGRRDVLSRRIIEHFLKSASACVREDKTFVQFCIPTKLEPDMMPLVSPLLQAILGWEKRYSIETHTAYRRYGMMNPNRPTADPWILLREHWHTYGELCFYNNHPGISDHLDPHEAGLLTLFFKSGDLRSPILKEGAFWRFDGGAACAANAKGPDGARQARFLTSLGEIWTFSDSRRDDLGLGFREFSTDPFLQAVLTGWHDVNVQYSCPHGLACSNGNEKGTVYLPQNSSDYLHFLSDKVRGKEKVCVVFRGFHKDNVRHLDSDTYYISGSS